MGETSPSTSTGGMAALSVSSNGSEWVKQAVLKTHTAVMQLSVSSNGSEWVKRIGVDRDGRGGGPFSILKRIGVGETCTFAML